MQKNEGRQGGLRGLRDRYPRLGLFPFSVLLGSVGAAGLLRNRENEMAVFIVVLMTAFGAYAAVSKDEFMVAGTGEGDERQKAIDQEASRISLSCIMVVSVLGFFWEIFTGRPGLFSFMCFVGAASHFLAFAYLRRRR